VRREEIEARVDELRSDHPGREDFIEAVRVFGESLDPDERKVLGQALLDRKPETGGFDVLNHRLEQGGWLKRTARRMDQRERKERER
jgi:hypothetical protein